MKNLLIITMGILLISCSTGSSHDSGMDDVLTSIPAPPTTLPLPTKATSAATTSATTTTTTTRPPKIECQGDTIARWRFSTAAKGETWVCVRPPAKKCRTGKTYNWDDTTKTGECHRLTGEEWCFAVADPITINDEDSRIRNGKCYAARCDMNASATQTLRCDSKRKADAVDASAGNYKSPLSAAAAMGQGCFGEITSASRYSNWDPSRSTYWRLQVWC